MTTSLKMPEQLLAIGQRLLDCGRDQEALEILEKLSHLADVPSATTVESRSCLAEIYLRRRRFAEARRHLNIVLAAQPDCPQAHYLMATALQQQETPDLRRAARHYRKAVGLDPEQPAYVADFGLCLLELGKATTGLRLLRQAVELAPDDVDYVRDLAMKLLDLGRAVEARQVALTALFRQPRNADLRKLWNDLRFCQARTQQQEEVRIYRIDDEHDPAILPFRTLQSKAEVRPSTPPTILKLPRRPERQPRWLRKRKTL
jgi:Tfp pilus assembly protein PilF